MPTNEENEKTDQSEIEQDASMQVPCKETY